MDFRYTTEQNLYRQAIREWLTKNLEPRARAIDEAEDGIPDDITAGMAELGMFGVTIPEEYGGMPLPDEERLIYAMITIQEIARADLSMSTPVYTLLTIGWSYIINRYGTDELKQEVLPAVADGKAFAGINTTEPGGGSDLGAIKTIAPVERGQAGLHPERREGLRERPQGVRQVGSAQRPLHARQDRPQPGPQGHDLHLGAGPSARHLLHHLQGHGPHGPVAPAAGSTRTSSCPASTCWAKRARASTSTWTASTPPACWSSAACLGGAEKALEISGEYTAQRTTFGKPLGKWEGISFEMADDWMQLDMLKLNLLRGAWMIGQEHTNPGQFGRKEINKIISTCKCLAPTLCHDIARHGMMYHGAFGYTKETPLEMLLRGVMSYEVGAEGGLMIMRGIIARDEWGDTHNPFKD